MPLRIALLVCAVGSACAGAGVFKPEYEYEEELSLALDGSATLNVHASVASLVALRGAHLDPDPLARIALDDVRAFFGAPAVPVAVSLSRRDGRRFVHASVRVADVHDLPRLAPFAWSAYRFARRNEAYEFRQTVGPPAGSDAVAGADQPWDGDELVAFRMHLPSEITFHNSPSGAIERGNILAWEQSLTDRRAGEPLNIEVHLEPTSILARTLLLFGSTVVAAAAALIAVVWWIGRQGRDEVTASPARR